MSSYSVDFEAAHRFGLLRREQQVLLLLAEGRTTEEAAQHLGVAPGTIRTYIATLGSKLSTRGRAQLVLKALQEGVLVIHL